MSGADLALPRDADVLEVWRGGTLDVLITETMNSIVGEPFMELGRAGDLVWIGFGEQVPSPTSRLPDRRLARHRLHVACPMRLDGINVPVVAAGDIFRPARDAAAAAREFDWDQQGANVYDSAVKKFWDEHIPGFAVVESVSADQAGDMTIVLSNRNSIRIFPNFSGPGEHWRYFRAGADAHLVVLPQLP